MMTDTLASTSSIKRKHTGFWLYELPFSLVLVLTVFGVAYTTFTRQPIKGYWELLVPFIWVVCIGAGSQNVNFSANATGLAIFTLVSLGTFTAGVHLLSWQVCLLGLVMALGIPALAWVENSALFFLLVAAGVFGILAVLWWHWRE